MVEQIHEKLSSLGKHVEYPQTYDPGILEVISREKTRESLSLSTESLPFHGFDLWNCYELSWLNLQGKPISAVASIRIPSTSVHIVESKSLKLYLNSFNQHLLESKDQVFQQIKVDLESRLGCYIQLDIQTLDCAQPKVGAFVNGHSLDALEISVSQYQRNPDLLARKPLAPNTLVKEGVGVSENKKVLETWWTHAFKSNCPVTGQPDWATLIIRYQGQAIDPKSLCLYLISYRNEAEFHEHCVEQIFIDIYNRLAPEKLTVYARYLRRGGIDINPFRSNFEDDLTDVYVSRQ